VLVTVSILYISSLITGQLSIGFFPSVLLLWALILYVVLWIFVRLKPAYGYSNLRQRLMVHMCSRMEKLTTARMQKLTAPVELLYGKPIAVGQNCGSDFTPFHE